MYYDDSRKELGDISAPIAESFANKIGYRFHLDYQQSFDNAMMRKPGFIYDQMDDCDSIIYADCDIIFNKNGSIEDIFRKPVNISMDHNGLCVGFMAMHNTPLSRKLISIWKDLGESYNIPMHDQGVMKMLVHHFSWIHDIIYMIPESIVSNPRCKSVGTLAHHFWSQSNTGIKPYMENVSDYYSGLYNLQNQQDACNS